MLKSWILSEITKGVLIEVVDDELDEESHIGRTGSATPYE